MAEITTWIDKPIDEINKTTLFAENFEGCVLEESAERFYLSNLQMGIELVLSEKKVVRTVFIYGTATSFFKGEIPLNLQFSLSRSEIIQRFGKPFRSGTRHRSLYLGIVQSWDKYQLANYAIRFEYNDEESGITKISIASLSLEKYLNAGLQ